MKKRIICLALSIIMILLVIFTVPVSVKASNIGDIFSNIFQGNINNANFTINAQSGYTTKVVANDYLPVKITVTNHGADFEGKIRVIFPCRDDENVMYQKDMVLSSGAKGTYDFTGYLVSGASSYNIQILDKKEKVVFSQLETLSTSSDDNEVLVGIISDDYSALSYMNGNTLWSNAQKTTKTVELGADFSDDYHALIPLDIIVISNFSTDYLTDSQIDALALWVQHGGMLFIGTGSQSNKTLSKLNGALVECSPSSLEKVTTDIGVSDFLYTQSSATYSGYNYSYGYDDADYQYTEDFDSLYYTQEGLELIDKICLEAFSEDTGYGTDKDTWPSYLEGDYYYFAYGYFRDYYDNMIMGDGNQTTQTSADPQNIDMLVFDNVVSDGSYKVSDVNGTEHDLVYASSVGQGTIALFTIDFTMNPMPKYDGARTVFMGYVYELFEMGSYSRNSNSYYSSYYSGYTTNMEKESELANNIGGAPIPPILLYGIIILVYFVFIFVLFFRQKKKGNMIKLWSRYLVLSGIIMLCVVALSLVTRNFKTRLDVATVNILDNGVRYENNYITATVPRAMNESIAVSSDYSLDLYDVYDLSYWDSMGTDFDNFKVGIYEKADSNEVVLGRTGALGQAHFAMSKTVNDTRDIDVKLVMNSSDYIYDVTNNYGCDLENCSILYSTGYNVYPIKIGNIKAGETKKGNGKLAELKAVYVYNQNPMTGASFLPNVSGQGIVGGMLLGSLSTSYRKAVQKGAIASYAADVIDDYNYYSSSTNYLNYDGVFVGFPKEKIQDTIQSGHKYNVKRINSVIKFIK